MVFVFLVPYSHITYLDIIVHVNVMQNSELQIVVSTSQLPKISHIYACHQEVPFSETDYAIWINIILTLGDCRLKS